MTPRKPTPSAALLVGAALLAAMLAAPAQAAIFSFAGVTDSGTLSATPFNGDFSYADPLPGFDGSLVLDSFSLGFAGQVYTLASADAGSVPMASFVGGVFVGVDYQDTSAAVPASRPWVQLVAGFDQLSQAQFSYDTSGTGVEGFGSYGVSAVPEPASALLLLVGLVVAGGMARRLQRQAGRLKRQTTVG